MGKHLLTVHSHKVHCEDDRAYHGVEFLAYKLSEEECVALFRQAEKGQQVDFEDDHHRKFALIDGENEAFTVVATEVSHGWI